MKFCGQQSCKIDANGRVKLSSRFHDDFREGGENLILHCLPEGALGVYSKSVWAQMRQGEPRPATKAASSVVFRRQLRRFGALSQPEKLTKQGRITIPPQFRELLNLVPGTDAVIVGTEMGVEIWQQSRWDEEFNTLHAHELKRAEAEMAADLRKGGINDGN